VLPRPLLVWSSSVRVVVPPEDNRALRWLKLLLYRTPEGLGEVEAEEAMALSEAIEPALRPANVTGAAGGGMPSSVKEPKVGTLAEVLGELAMGETPRGEADKVGVLNGCTEKELLRLAATARSDVFDVCAGGKGGRDCSGVGGELESKSRAFRRAEMGSVAPETPAW
jgi:hypothetical protein